jgi:vitamin B12 transporter
MYKKLAIVMFLLSCFLDSNAQVSISGTVRNTQKEPLPNAGISIKNSYSGTTSNADGSFAFSTADTGKQVLQVSILGYSNFELEVLINGQNLIINPILKEEISELKAVTLTAGSFEASDKKRTTVLKSIDVVTTAGQQADIVAALKTLPGAQQVGETEGLFVRGGTGGETKVFIDGMLVSNAFYSNVPDVAQRGRFSPLLFKGTNFSSGGYSAQFGGALSSVLLLESLDLPTRSESNWIISSAQMSVTVQQLNKAKNTSIAGGVAYSNLAPYFAIVPQKYSFTKPPEIINAELHIRHKTKNGMLKFYTYANHTAVGYDKYSVENETWRDRFALDNKNLYTNLTYTGKLSETWKVFAGVSISYNEDDIKKYILAKDTINKYFLPVLSKLTQQGKVILTKNLKGISKVNIGAEWQRFTDNVNAKDSIPYITVHENYLAGYAEAEIYLGEKFAARTGARVEYSSLLKAIKLSPRLSLAYKLNDKSQLSAAYGDFYQNPDITYLFRQRDLGFTRATHYILNYQYVFNKQTFRVEFFQKNYASLVNYTGVGSKPYANNGNGYARGFEIFWRDKTSLKNLDYWVAYSFLDTKRKFLDYPSKVQPGFAATHTASVVVKKFIEPIATYLSMTYTYASGRPYYNPNQPVSSFMRDRTISYNTMGIQLNYLTRVAKAYTVLIFNMSNALGSKQVFSYRFAAEPDNNGYYRSEQIVPQAKRFFFVGAYISIGKDRRKEVID